MSASFKFTNLIAAAIFAIFSSLQWNDLDPAIYDNPSIADAIGWSIFYGFIAVLFVIVLFYRLPRWILVMALVMCLAQLGRTGPGLWENLTGDDGFDMTQASMAADDPRIELSREFFGALIALCGVGIISFQNSRLAR